MSDKIKLSQRIRPNSEAAPWVVEEVRKLEQRIEGLESMNADQKHNTAEEPGDLCFSEVTGLHAEADLYRIAELQERIELALRLNKANFPGFIPDALRGRKFSELPKDVQDCLLEYEAQEKPE